MGIFKKCLELSEMARNAIKSKKTLFLCGIVYWYWIVSFLVLNILGIVNKNNPIMLRSLVSTIYQTTTKTTKEKLSSRYLKVINRLVPYYVVVGIVYWKKSIKSECFLVKPYWSFIIIIYFCYISKERKCTEQFYWWSKISSS